MVKFSNDGRLLPWRYVAEFQLSVARRWLDLGDGSADPPVFRFVSYFASLNALYWLWGVVEARPEFEEHEIAQIEQATAVLPEHLRDRLLQRIDTGPRGEARLLRDLVGKLGEQRAEVIISQDAVRRSVRFFQDRPLRRMDKRTVAEPDGEPREGKKYQKQLREAECAVGKLQALCGTLYLIRCNLVHGSKVVDALDEDLLEHAVPALRSIADAAINSTERAFPWT